MSQMVKTELLNSKPKRSLFKAIVGARRLVRGTWRKAKGATVSTYQVVKAASKQDLG